MAELKIGRPAPEIVLPTDSGDQFRLSQYRGKPVILTFYSDGTTEGCALQNDEFSALLPEFTALGAIVAAIAPQTAAACASFRKKRHLGHLLLADDNLKAVKAYGLWQQKKLWGHEFMGVIRSTIIVDAAGKVAADIKATRIKGHAAKVLDALRQVLA